MAEEKIIEAEEVAAPAESKPAKKKAAPKKEAAKKETKKAVKEEKAEESKIATFAKPTAHDFEVIDAPHITEKTMALIQNANKITVKVSSKANKIEIKEAFQRIFQVPVTDVKTSNVSAKVTTRGGRYKGTISGYKKAVVTVAEGAAIDLFKE